MYMKIIIGMIMRHNHSQQLNYLLASNLDMSTHWSGNQVDVILKPG